MDSIEILIQIRKIVRSINLESKKIQKEFGISIPQLLCMSHLSQCADYQSTHGKLMELLSLNSSTITGIINRLEKKGFVARIPKTDDRRVTSIALTSTGLKLLKETPNILHDRLSKKLASLKEQDLINIKSSLDTIIKVMEIEDIDASPLLFIDDPVTDKPKM